MEGAYVKSGEVRDNNEPVTDVTENNSERIETKLNEKVLEFREGDEDTRIYEMQKQIAGLEINEKLGAYSGHGIEHVQEVIIQTDNILDAMKDYGFEIDEEEKRDALIAARYHDIGMAAPEKIEKIKEMKQQYDEYKEIERDLANQINEKEQQLIELKSTGLSESDIQIKNLEEEKEVLTDRYIQIRSEMTTISTDQAKAINALRKEHATASALWVLENGVNEEQVGKLSDEEKRNIACSIMLHSKSNSNSKMLTDRESTREACRMLIEKHNQVHPDKPYSTDFSDESLDRISMTASALRIGDNLRSRETARFTDGNKCVLDEQARLYKEFPDGSKKEYRKEEVPETYGILAGEMCTDPIDIHVEGEGPDKCLVFRLDANHMDNVEMQKNMVVRETQESADNLSVPQASGRIGDLVKEIESGYMGKTNGVTSKIELVIDGSPEEAEQLQTRLRMWLSGMRTTPGDNLTAAYKDYANNDRLRVVSRRSLQANGKDVMRE